MTKTFVKAKKTVMRITSLLYPEPPPPFKDLCKNSNRVTSKDVALLTELMESDLIESGVEGSQALQYFRSNKLN